MNGKSMHLICSREGVSPAESIPCRTGQKVHPGADPAKRKSVLTVSEQGLSGRPIPGFESDTYKRTLRALSADYVCCFIVRQQDLNLRVEPRIFRLL